MKRSEMKEVIKKVWIGSSSWPTDDIVAEGILEAIEKTGMLPPTWTRNKSKFPGDVNHYTVNEWEEE